MTVDLRQQSIFNANRDIFFDSKVSRKARAVYLAICFLLTIPDLKGNLTLDYIAKAAGYNKRIAKEAVKELEILGFVITSKNKRLIGLIK